MENTQLIEYVKQCGKASLCCTSFDSCDKANIPAYLQGALSALKSAILNQDHNAESKLLNICASLIALQGD